VHDVRFPAETYMNPNPQPEGVTAMGAMEMNVEAVAGSKFTVEAQLGNHTCYIDQPKDKMGDDKGPSPLQYLLFSLAGCIGSIGRIIAMQKKIELRGMKISVSGSVDKDFLLGKTTEGRAGFTQITVTVDVDADMTDEEKKQFVHEIDSRCPVSDNLMNGTTVNVQTV
jgi:putative redox protein